MTTTSIENLYEDYRAVSEYPPDYTLDFFQKNAIYLKNLPAFKNDNELKLFIELSWQHVNALYLKDRYNETVDNAINYLKIINSKINQHDLTFIKDDWYYGILLVKGIATYRLQDYKTSTAIFEELTEHDSKNENYKNWLRYSMYGKRLWISKTIAVLCAVLFLAEVFFKKYISSFYLRFSLDSIALIGLIGTLIYDYYIKISFRKSNQK
jgi:hypothetical protein